MRVILINMIGSSTEDCGFEAADSDILLPLSSLVISTDYFVTPVLPIYTLVVQSVPAVAYHGFGYLYPPI